MISSQQSSALLFFVDLEKFSPMFAVRYCCRLVSSSPKFTVSIFSRPTENVLGHEKLITQTTYLLVLLKIRHGICAFVEMFKSFFNKSVEFIKY